MEEEPGYILLTRTEYGDIVFINSILEPLSEAEAERAIEKRMSIARQAGYDHDKIFKWRVVGKPIEVSREFADGASK